MSPNDKRHGTNAGYIAGCRDECCRAAARNYHKRLVHDHHHGRRRMIDGTGTRRRIQALVALGWSHRLIAEHIGVTRQVVTQWAGRDVLYRTSAARVASAYDDLCMKFPPQTTKHERITAQRMRTHAKKLGWLPPLAWDDIDNDSAPNPGAWTSSNSLDEYEHLRSLGESHEQILIRLGVTEDAIHTAQRRARKAA